MSAPPVLDALSISQPWAWMIISGRKPHWRFSIRQLAQARARVGRRFAVHAAKSYDADAAEDLADYGIAVPDRPALAAGAIVGVATLARVITVAEALTDPDLEDQRLYISGPVCLVLADVVAVDPIPARGFLGFWPLPDVVAEALAAQIAGVDTREGDTTP